MLQATNMRSPLSGKSWLSRNWLIFESPVLMSMNGARTALKDRCHRQRSKDLDPYAVSGSAL
jgi:hypothetical protein